jgi:hypothetical protein
MCFIFNLEHETVAQIFYGGEVSLHWLLIIETKFCCILE